MWSIFYEVAGGSEVISPGGKPIPKHNPLEEITSDPPGPMMGQGPGWPEKAFKGLVRPVREALRRLIKPFEEGRIRTSWSS